MATVDNVTVEEEIITVHDENDGGKKTPEQISQKTQHNQNDEEDVNTKPPRLKLCCGCCSSRKKDRADPVKENMANSRNYPNASCANTLKLFLDSPVYFLFVIVSTLIISYFILAELMLDITAAPCNETTSTSSCFNGVSTVLHWFCFAVLVIYSVELCFRVGLWRLQLIKDFIAIVDCIVMLCAFVVFVTFTFMDSQTSTLDAISLIIIFRLIRILSIIKNMTINVKRECSRRNAAAEMRICHLEKQITDKTFEIRQLQLFLGDTSQINDPQIRDAIESSKARREMGAAADTELELAIAMSKQIYENQEYNNQGYLGEKPGNKLPKPDHDDFTVIVHPRPQPRESMTSDLGTANDHDEYGLFPKSLRDREDVSGNFTGAISKHGMKNCGPLNCNNNKDPEHWSFSLDLTSIKSISDDKKSPVSIFIDSEILVCDDKKLNDPSDSSSPTGKIDTENNPKSDAGSDGYVTDMSSNTKCHNYEMHSLSRPKSALLSESGYQSEEPLQNGSLTKKNRDNVIGNYQFNNGLIEMKCL